jgi:glyoxylase-like metal-dependent hydrolase (beta-lactamase superfamily II)
MSAAIIPFFHERTNTVTYLVADPATRTAAVIDPVRDYDAASGRTGTAAVDKVIERVRGDGLTVAWILETHVHADHLSAAPLVKQALGGRIGIGARVVEVQKTFGALFNAEAGFTADGRQFDHLFADGESFRIGGLEATVMHTPGHTPACVCYVIGDAVFVGDTLFMPDSGTARCDFPGGDATTLFRSIRRILSLPPATRVFVCHDYGNGGKRPVAWETTVAAERAANIHVKDGTSEAEFVAMRSARDATLSMPALIAPSVQVNIRAGSLPPAEANGRVYLKVPVDTL